MIASEGRVLVTKRRVLNLGGQLQVDPPIFLAFV